MLFFSILLTVLFHLVQKPIRFRQRQFWFWSLSWPKPEHSHPSLIIFCDHDFQQIKVLHLVWSMKGKCNGPTELYQKPLFTTFLHFKWSLNHGITRHYAKNAIFFEQSHYPRFCLLWFNWIIFFFNYVSISTVSSDVILFVFLSITISW